MSLFIINFKVTSNLVIVIVSVYFTYKFFLKKKLQFYGALRTLLINKFVFFPNQVFNNLRYVKSIKNKFIQNFVNDYKKNNNMLANLNIFNNLITELPKYIIELCVVIIILTVVIISSGSGELYGPNLSVYGVFGYAFFRLLPHLNLSVRSYLSVKYYLDDKFILHHYDVPLLTKKTDGPYGPTKPYIKIGIYRIGDTGTTTYAYKNLVIKNKKKSSFEKVDNSKGATKFFVIVSRKSDPSVQFRFEDKDNGKARTQALKKCFTAGHDDCEVSLVGTK